MIISNQPKQLIDIEGSHLATKQNNIGNIGGLKSSKIRVDSDQQKQIKIQMIGQHLAGLHTQRMQWWLQICKSKLSDVRL